MNAPRAVPEPAPNQRELSDPQLSSLALVLRLGVLFAGVLLLVGVGLAIGQAFPFDPTVNVPLLNQGWFRWPTLTSRLASGSGVAVATTGLLVLVATPGARVLWGAYHFARNRDRTLAAIAAIVFGMLLAGAFLLGPLLG